METATNITAEEDLEMKLLSEAIFRKYGYDFKNYAQASFKRRLMRACFKLNCGSLPELLHKVLTEPDFFARLLNELTVTVTELFRDPHFYFALRNEVVPYLRSYPEIKIWCAGCAAGEEVFSLAILFLEEGLYERSIFYGTDINPLVLKRAREGILPLDAIKDGTKNYFAAGGKRSLHNYYRAKYEAAIIDQNLRRQIVFSDHNLVTDRSFGEMQLIFCRNVLIYFNRELQSRVLKLFTQSLSNRGFLCLGMKENLNFSSVRDHFDEFCKAERIYRRKH
jgi:chemotaxis protein methyltransferase CheR